MTDQKPRMSARIQEKWARLHRLLATVPANRIEDPGAVGEWSMKDMMGHIPSWESYTGQDFRRMLRGEPQPRITMENVDRWNAEWATQKLPLPLAEIQEEMHRVHQELAAFLEVLAGECFEQGHPVLRRVREDTYSHYDEHRQDIRRWLHGQALE